jgi:hypothetical protein
MSEFVKNMFHDASIQEARAEKFSDGLRVVFCSTENASYITKQELVDMLTLINQKEEQIKMNKWLAEKVSK